jgi:hypothetical protein
MTELEKELLAALKDSHEEQCWTYSHFGKCPCKEYKLIAKAEAQEAGDE